MTPRRLPPRWLVPVLLAPLLLSLPFFFGKLLLFRDILHFFVPVHAFIAEALRHGHLPQWNPLLYGGYPLLAEPDAGVFYPPNLLFQIAPPQVATTLFVLLHLPIAAGGAYLLARALDLTEETAALAATGYVTSGYLLSMHCAHLYFASAAWFPFAVAMLARVAVLSSRGRVVAAGLVVALVVLNGDFQVAFLSGLLGFGLALCAGPRRERLWSAARVASALALGGALGAVQLWPTVLLTQTTTRAHGVPLQEAAGWALAPTRWLDFLTPMPFGISYPENTFWGAPLVDSIHRIPWAPSLYLSPLFVVLPLFGIWRTRSRRLQVLFGAGLFALLLAAGTALPVFAVWHRFMPFGNVFRYPEKFALVTTLALVLLGAAAVPTPTNGEGKERRRAAFPLWGVAIVLALTAAWVAQEPPRLESAVAAGLQQSLAAIPVAEAMTHLSLALVHAALVCMVCGVLLAVGRHTRMASAVLLAVVLLDGVWLGSKVLSFGNGAFLSSPPPIVDQVRAAIPTGAAGRLWHDRACSYPGGGQGTLLERVRQWEWRTGKENFLGLFGVADVVGYGASESQRKIDVFHAVGQGDVRRAARLFGAAAWLDCDADGVARVTPVESPLPRAFFAEPEQLGWGPMLQRLADPSFDFAATALVGGLGRQLPPTVLPPDALHVAVSSGDRPEEVEVQTGGRGGFLVLADSFADGWTATVDGARTPVWRVDGLWRGVFAPAGTQRVVFHYSTPGLSTGAVVSILALCLCLALVFFPRRGRGEVESRPGENPASPGLDPPRSV